MTFPTYSSQVVREGDNTKTFVVNSDVSRGQLVKITGADREVAPSDTDGEDCIGFAEYDASSGESVSVAMDTCVVRAVTGTGTISRGDPVTSHGGTGDNGDLQTASSGDMVVGYALNADGTAGNEDSVRVYVSLSAVEGQ